MPTIPTVFRNVRPNDVQQRPFKAYKGYTVTNTSYSDGKFYVQKAVHKKFTAHVGDATYNYPINLDGTNQHVVWNWVDHRYYRYPYDIARCHELTNINKVEKMLFITASILTAPYFEVGERIKPSTFNLISQIHSSSVNNYHHYSIELKDDAKGNLRDYTIPTSSMASSSRLQCYLSFNEEFRRFDDQFGTITKEKIKYELGKVSKRDAVIENVEIQRGITLHVSESNNYPQSGLSGYFANTGANFSYVQVPDNELFNNLEKCDQWAMSIWINPVAIDSTGSLVSKGGVIKEKYYDLNDKLTKTRTVEVTRPLPGVGDFSQYRTPVELSFVSGSVHYQASDGTDQLHISASAVFRGNWMNVIIANSASLCKFYVNGNASGTSGSIPKGITKNSADMMIGSDSITSGLGGFYGNIAEFRLYDYAMTPNIARSIANQDFYTGSLYQTNVAGNIFYRNGQAVISSPMPKFNDIFFTSSVAAANNFTASYKGQHTIYENEVMVRVPKGTFNVSVNPSAVFRPATGLKNECNTAGGSAEQTNGPGQFRKTMFTSGSAIPYITTIGLYNDNAQLLAVGKLAEPIQKRNDIDMNFVVRWDY